jgi:hypothetical protein
MAAIHVSISHQGHDKMRRGGVFLSLFGTADPLLKTKQNVDLTKI